MLLETIIAPADLRGLTPDLQFAQTRMQNT
jgi:hypothetical protein